MAKIKITDYDDIDFKIEEISSIIESFEFLGLLNQITYEIYNLRSDSDFRFMISRSLDRVISDIKHFKQDCHYDE